MAEHDSSFRSPSTMVSNSSKPTQQPLPGGEVATTAPPLKDTLIFFCDLLARFGIPRVSPEHIRKSKYSEFGDLLVHVDNLQPFSLYAAPSEFLDGLLSQYTLTRTSQSQQNVWISCPVDAAPALVEHVSLCASLWRVLHGLCLLHATHWHPRVWAHTAPTPTAEPSSGAERAWEARASNWHMASFVRATLLRLGVQGDAGAVGEAAWQSLCGTLASPSGVSVPASALFARILSSPHAAAVLDLSPHALTASLETDPSLCATTATLHFGAAHAQRPTVAVTVPVPVAMALSASPRELLLAVAWMVATHASPFAHYLQLVADDAARMPALPPFPHTLAPMVLAGLPLSSDASAVPPQPHATTTTATVTSAPSATAAQPIAERYSPALAPPSVSLADVDLLRALRAHLTHAASTAAASPHLFAPALPVACPSFARHYRHRLTQLALLVARVNAQVRTLSRAPVELASARARLAKQQAEVATQHAGVVAQLAQHPRARALGPLATLRAAALMGALPISLPAPPAQLLAPPPSTAQPQPHPYAQSQAQRPQDVSGQSRRSRPEWNNDMDAHPPVPATAEGPTLQASPLAVFAGAGLPPSLAHPPPLPGRASADAPASAATLAALPPPTMLPALSAFAAHWATAHAAAPRALAHEAVFLAWARSALQLHAQRHESASTSSARQASAAAPTPQQCATAGDALARALARRTDVATLTNTRARVRAALAHQRMSGAHTAAEPLTDPVVRVAALTRAPTAPCVSALEDQLADRQEGHTPEALLGTPAALARPHAHLHSPAAPPRAPTSRASRVPARVPVEGAASSPRAHCPACAHTHSRRMCVSARVSAALTTLHTTSSPAAANAVAALAPLARSQEPLPPPITACAGCPVPGAPLPAYSRALETSRRVRSAMSGLLSPPAAARMHEYPRTAALALDALAASLCGAAPPRAMFPSLAVGCVRGLLHPTPHAAPLSLSLTSAGREVDMCVAEAPHAAQAVHAIAASAVLRACARVRDKRVQKHRRNAGRAALLARIRGSGRPTESGAAVAAGEVVYGTGDVSSDTADRVWCVGECTCGCCGSVSDDAQELLSGISAYIG